jgi:hypothetical protein
MTALAVDEFVPYQERRPKTDDLRELRDELTRVREEHGRRSAEAAEAFEELVRASAAQGKPVDALRRYTANEVERFFSSTIPGPDGHVYWDGPKSGFTRNDGKNRVARRWWWGHRAGVEPGPYEDVVATCGDLNCINPEHCQAGRDLRRRRFSDEQMLGSVKVAALRLGRPPRMKEWGRLGLEPSANIFRLRFGGWSNVIRQAGLTYVPQQGVKASPEECVAAIRRFHALTGNWPTTKTLRTQAAALHAAGLPSGASTIARHHGSWDAALRKAKSRTR